MSEQITANLANPVPGKVINMAGRVYLVAGLTGKCLDHLPGGRGVKEYVLTPILGVAYPMTEDEKVAWLTANGGQ